jgi:hypothetical protein
MNINFYTLIEELLKEECFIELFIEDNIVCASISHNNIPTKHSSCISIHSDTVDDSSVTIYTRYSSYTYNSNAIDIIESFKDI